MPPYSSGPNPETGPPKPGRVFFPYTECEEYAHGGGMWRTATAHERGPMVADAANLMRDPDRFRAAMIRATLDWPKSCAMNLTAEGNNQRAWMGHAGTYLATGSVEECTRLGWHRLTDDEQRAANRAADEAIAHWRQGYQGWASAHQQLDIFGSEVA